MYRAPKASPLRIAVAVVTWFLALATFVAGDIVGGTGRVVLTVLGIVLLLAAVAYVGLQLWWLNRVQQRSRAPDGDHRPLPPR
jgi:hypothetical protein